MSVKEGRYFKYFIASLEVKHSEELLLSRVRPNLSSREAKPPILAQFLGRGSFWGVHTQHLSDQSLGLKWNALWHVKEASAYLGKEVSLILAFEGVTSTQNHKEYDAKRPHVCCEATIVFLLNYLRSHIRWCSTEDLKLLIWRSADTETKIYEFHIISVIYKYIL